MLAGEDGEARGDGDDGEARREMGDGCGVFVGCDMVGRKIDCI